MLGKLRIFSVGYRVFVHQSRDHSLFNLKGFVTSARWACSSCTVEMKRNWNKPDGESELKIYNSLTKEKVWTYCA